MTASASRPFIPCAVIPVFNHHQYLESVLVSLLARDLPCVVVDDGSHPEGARMLDAIVARHEKVTLLRQPHNTGKGAAVCRALQHAREQGYSHALQVDADGQHEQADVPAMLAAARARPAAVVSGSRPYSSMPAGRRRGRRFTDLWVYLHTLCGDIEDSMCGFRVYPLAATNALLASVPVGRRMDFDTDIIVRLFWRGVPVVNVPTRVVYRDDIASHFDLWRDNARISLMHARLFFGMLVRLPVLLGRCYGRKRSGY